MYTATKIPKSEAPPITDSIDAVEEVIRAVLILVAHGVVWLIMLIIG